MKIKQKLQRGFTMIELIMVMSIIGVLAGVILIQYPAATRRARDTERKASMDQYRVALEQFANKNNGIYKGRTGTTITANGTLCSDLGLSSSLCPADPRDGSTVCGVNRSELCRYYYQSGPSTCGSANLCALYYIVWGRIENGATHNYWVVCSDGRAGEVDSTKLPRPAGSQGTCPL